MHVARSADATVNPAREDDLGTVIREARRAAGLTQAELGGACGYSQSVVSRIESGNRATYDVRVLRRLAEVLDLPPHVLGVAAAGRRAPAVNRRHFIAAAGALVTSGFLPRTGSGITASSVRAITAGQRQLDASVLARHLAEPVLAHLRLAQRLTMNAGGQAQEAELAGALSEVAGFAGWLHWDMRDLGSARRFYDLAIAAALTSGNRVLAAYMAGSLASFLAEEGDGIEALNLVASASMHLGVERPAAAEAWLSAMTALAHAAVNDERSARAALDRSEEASRRTVEDAGPAWPWVFAFEPAKVEAHRLGCAVMLGHWDAALRASHEARPVLEAGTRQALLWQLDHAYALVKAGHADQALNVANGALAQAAVGHGGRFIARAERLRRGVVGTMASAAVSDFDERLRASKCRLAAT